MVLNEDGLVRVGILGCGNVGSALVGLLEANADLITRRSGVRIEVTRVAVQNLTKERSVSFAPGVLTNEADDVVADRDVDVIVEMIGGVEPARSLILTALKSGKPVVTANKELLANFGEELFEVAATAGVDLLFEASVAGGIPLIRPLRESLVGERIRRVTGIVNGTTNYVLTKMTEERCSFAEAVAEAQELGYAEPDPTADIDGFDAAAKAAIIASIAFGARVVAGDVSREGIRDVTADDIGAAAELGYVVKLLAVAEEYDGAVSVRVHPAMVPVGHPLASVSGSFNAVFIEGEAVGQLMLLGRGAGGGPTSSALLGDLIDAAKNLHSGARGATVGALERRPIRPIDETSSQFYVSLDAADRPGVLAAIAGVFGEHDVSIQSMQQKGQGDDARLIFVTHLALEVGGGGDDPRRARSRGRQAGRIGVARRRGRGMTELAHAGWPGLIEAYRDRLPVTRSHAGRHAQRGQHAARRSAAPVGAGRRARAVEDRGREPHRLVQGPRHDRRDLQGRRRRRQGRGVRVDRQHVGVGRGVRGAGGHDRGGHHPRRSRRARQARAGAHPRRQGRSGARQLRRRAAHRPPTRRTRWRDRRQLDQPVPHRRAEDRGVRDLRRARASARRALHPGRATRATSPRTGRATPSTQRDGLTSSAPRMLGWQAAGSAPLVLGEPVLHPETIATAIRIGNPASWDAAIAARDESGGAIGSVTDAQILDAYRLLASLEGVFVEPASAASVAGLLQGAAQGLVERDEIVVCTVTGHGLKDPNRAIAEIEPRPAVDANIDQVLAELGLVAVKP